MAAEYDMAAEPLALGQDEQLTGEAVALVVQPLGFFLRALGTLIDMALSTAVLLALAWAAGAAAGSVSGILGVGAIVLSLVVLPAAVETLSRGRSLGRVAVGGRIVRSDGGAAGVRHAAIRALVGVLELWMTAGAVAALTGAFTPRAQRLGDLLAGTYCQRTRTPPLPPAAGGVPATLATWAAAADVARMPAELARRCAQFTAVADRMDVPSRRRVAALLAVEVAAFVAPVPVSDAEDMIRAVLAVRRDREYAAIVLRDRRVTALLPPGPDGRDSAARS